MCEFNNLVRQCDQFLGAVLQLVEQSHRLFLGEMNPLTEEQRIRRNKMIAIPCMCLVCGLVLWFIFMPSASDGEKGIHKKVLTASIAHAGMSLDLLIRKYFSFLCL